MSVEYLLGEMANYSDEELAEALTGLPSHISEAVLRVVNSTAKEGSIPRGPLEQMQALDPGYREQAHLRYLSDRIAEAVSDVESGKNRWLIVGMPPRSGKSQLSSVGTPLWLLHKHPDWKMGLISHSPNLAVSWGRQIRRVAEDRGHLLGGLEIARDAGAVSGWETTQGGSVMARSPGQSLAGYGFKVLLVDDPVRDFAGAHSDTQRDALWDWWRANALTRLETPTLVVVVMTRWHEDDLVGRILSPDYEGDPAEWEVISFPAIAEEHDVLGRSPGQPLYSPILNETEEEALQRWEGVKSTQGLYVWNALYQQRPSSPTGSIFDLSKIRYWTPNKSKATDDGSVKYFRPEDHMARGRWLDSWDMAFKGEKTSDYVVGQRWVMAGPDRHLIAQVRGRWDFVETLDRIGTWTDPESGHSASPYGRAVHERLVEDKANGTAIMSVLRKDVAGLIPINPKDGKEARARAETPMFESGNVYLPLPSDPGNEWVAELVSELREFPTGAHDDQVDALSQALARFRAVGTPGTGGISNPARARRGAPSDLLKAARAGRPRH